MEVTYTRKELGSTQPTRTEEIRHSLPYSFNLSKIEIVYAYNISRHKPRRTMIYSYDIRLFDGVRYMKEVDCTCIVRDWEKHNVALKDKRDALATDKAEYKEASKIFSRRLTECEQERDKLKKRVSSYEFDYVKRHSKYEHLLKVLEERTKELAKQNKEILALRDTIEALKFDRDVAMNKLDKTVEPTTRADKMRERVKCELCGKDLSRNSLRGHMKKMHIADGDDDDDVSITCLSGVD